MTTVVSTILMVIAFVGLVYLVAIFLRLLATWFPAQMHGPLLPFVVKITEPYLKLFRRIKVFQYRGIDLSPIPAIIVLQVLLMILLRLAAFHVVTVGLVLALIVSLLGQAVAWIFMILAILALVRVVSIFLGANSTSGFWMILDHLLQPMVYRIVSKLSPRAVIPYGTGLGLFSALCFLLWIAAGYLFGQIALLLSQLPF